MVVVLPEDVKFIIDKIESNGYEAFIVGGCVRDLLMNLIPHDWDITTSAEPQDIKEIFKEYKLVTNGEKHGTIGVVINNSVYEITTYRIDGEYSDSRHPQSVSFTRNITEDLARRDFTVNAIAYSESSGFIDPFNGIDDIKLNLIRCVRNPDDRFKEDALRILRALRFSSVYNFEIETDTALALKHNKDLLNNIAVERISSEFNKILCGENIGYIMKNYKDVFATFIPEIRPTFNCDQNTPHHDKNVWDHTVAAVSEIRSDLLLRMVMFLHDTGKPITKKTGENGVDHFYKHQSYSAELARKILRRLKYPRVFTDDVVTLVLYHDERDFKNKVKLKKFLNKVGVDKFRLLLEIRKSDTSAQSTYMIEEKIANLQKDEEMFNFILENNECYTLKQLQLSGFDLICAGITNGSEIGDILDFMLEQVINEHVINDKEILLNKSIQWHKKHSFLYIS